MSSDLGNDLGPDWGWFEYEEFASIAAFQAGLKHFHENSEVRWTNTASDLRSGGVHGIRYKVEKDDKDNPRLLLQHWVHWPENKAPVNESKKRRQDLLIISTQTKTAPGGTQMIRPIEIEWLGKKTNNKTEIFQALSFMGEVSKEIQKNNDRSKQRFDMAFNGAAQNDADQVPSQTQLRDEIPNLYDIAQRTKFKTSFSLEGMYFNGEFNFKESNSLKRNPIFALPLLRAMLGIEEDSQFNKGQSFTKSFSTTDPNTQAFSTIQYRYERSEEGFTLRGVLRQNDASLEQEETQLYKLVFERKEEADEDNYTSDIGFKLVDMEMLGNKPDITDHVGVVRAMRAMKYIHMAIARREAPQLTNILHENDLKDFLRAPTPPVGKEIRTMVQVFGANTDAVFSDKEKSIGSNGALVIRDFKQGPHWVKLGIGIDWGVTFGDAKKEFYNTIAHNYGRFLRHDTAPHLKPYVNTILNLETHEHEDHIRGVARLAKFGFTLPPLVMNKHTASVLRRMLSEEKVEKDIIEKISSQILVLGIDKYKKGQGNKQHVFGDTVINESVEEIWSEEENCNKYFPLLSVHHKNHPQSKTIIRVGPAGHSAHALMFQVDGVLYTGDYKMDQTMPAHLRTDKDWLAQAGKTASVHIQESTNAVREASYNADVETIKENREEILSLHSDSRILADLIGSNAVDMELFAQALGNVRKEKLLAEGKSHRTSDGPYEYIIFAGSAVRNKYSDLNKSDGFKSKILKEYGIKTLHISSSKAKELLRDSSKNNYAVIMTGTQDEALSITHRVSRDLHDLIELRGNDVVMRLQAPIPGDDRAALRVAQNNRYRHDFGCTVYDAVEMAVKGKPIYTSSHASRDDYKIVHELTGDLEKLLNHGGPEQLKGMKEYMESIGARARIPDKQIVYKIEPSTKSVSIAAETPEERVGYREIRGDLDEFYDKQRQQATVYRVKDRWQGVVADAMYRFESVVAAGRNMARQLAPTARGSNIATQFNKASKGAAFPRIGILHPNIKHPYYAEHKNLKLFVALDTETTGKSAAHDVHTDISFVATEPESGKILRKKTLKYAVPRYLMAAPGALLVTNNRDPETLHKGLSLRKYALKMLEVFRDWPSKITKNENARALFFGYRNGLFDDPITMRMMGQALSADTMKPMATHGNMQLDVFYLYSAMLAMAPHKIKGVQDVDGNYIRNLGEVCKANGIVVDETKTHGSLYDAELTAQLLHKIKAADPEIFEQMVMNCDFSSSRRSPMIDHILGQDLHVNDQAALFGYVDRRDRTCTPRMGALVTIDTKVNRATDAIVIDIAKIDPYQLDQLSDQELLATMNDPQGPFAVVKLNNSPMLFPPNFIYRDTKVRAKAVGKIPKSTLMQRANALKHMGGSHAQVGQNFIQRVQRLYPQSRLVFNPQGAANQNKQSANHFRMPSERVFSLFHVIKGINQTKSRHYKEAAKLLQNLKLSEGEFKRGFDKDSFWRGSVNAIKDISLQSGGRDFYIEDIRMLVEWMAYDVNPKYLDPERAKRMNALKSSILHGPDDSQTMTIAKFRREVEEIENDQELRAKIFGTGDDADQAWSDLKTVYLSYAQKMESVSKFEMTEDKREELRRFRRTDQPPRPRMG
jgi:mRNA degradation ribonuclease J1/J2/exonuclease I